MMGPTSVSMICSPIIFSTLILYSCLILHVCSTSSPAAAATVKNREALEIIIGGGGGSSAPPPSPNFQNCPPPPPPPVPSPRLPPKPPSPSPLLGFESAEIKAAYFIIQRFKLTIKDDPMRITKTWAGKRVCKYEGFYCDVYPRTGKRAVSGIDFGGYRFAGFGGRLELDTIMGIKEIAYFRANSNNFTGSVPSKIKDIPFLYEFDLSNNKLSGSFPSSVLAGTNLTFLDLRFNRFAGAIVPPQVFNLDLDILFLNNDDFASQNLPDSLGNTHALYVTLANNRFTGSIPRSIGRLSKTLVEILLLNNQLSGCLPYEIGLLEKLKLFDASRNQLTGPIPLSFSCLKRLEILNLTQNQLFGPVPEMLCKLPNLFRLTLSYNFFTQVGPACRILIERKVLDVRMNCILDLPFQRSKWECAQFFSRPRHCPDEKWRYTRIPCRNYAAQSSLEADSDKRPAAPVTYGAISPHA